MSTPTPEIRPGDAEYADLYIRWLADGQPDMLEILREDRAYRALRINDDYVVFSLAAYQEGATTLDRSSPISGYGLAMGVVQRSWNGPRQLPKS